MLADQWVRGRYFTSHTLRHTSLQIAERRDASPTLTARSILLSHTRCDGRPDDQCVSALIAQRRARPCSAGGRAADTCIAAIAFRTICSEQRSPCYGNCTRLKRR
ncbi:hypothetical protein DGN16_08865 [Xanthomonas citri pv. fuscans]|uniref:Uncharacterized protein n=1 Tax=Xanthomonas citri pv. phaseoli var. fuscans TaxID=473423 RepID=A0A808FLD5_XANCI|nr:hypothetical protein DGN16_08865 [Xanthomonas citri pv. fuscans]QWN08491.1 hypothetical protein DGN11_14705 [Xanthomonas citri pv. fuscans]